MSGHEWTYDAVAGVDRCSRCYSAADCADCAEGPCSEDAVTGGLVESGALPKIEHPASFVMTPAETRVYDYGGFLISGSIWISNDSDEDEEVIPF